MAFNTVEFDLSLRSLDTGRFITGKAYTVAGITNEDGSPRELSIGQLVMAICLARASELEVGKYDRTSGKYVDGIIPLMEDMNSTSAKLEAMTEIEQTIVTWAGNQTTSNSYNLSSITIATGTYAGTTFYDFLTKSTYGLNVDLNGESTVWINTTGQNLMYDDFVSTIESKMDELNSFSQQKMIELQSLTNKRDQSYDMISNILKSLNTTMIGNINNF